MLRSVVSSAQEHGMHQDIGPPEYTNEILQSSLVVCQSSTHPCEEDATAATQPTNSQDYFQSALTHKQVREIFNSGEWDPQCGIVKSKHWGQIAEVARLYNVTRKTVRDIWNRRTWKETTSSLCPKDGTLVADEVEVRRPGRPKGAKDNRPRKKRYVSNLSEDTSAQLTWALDGLPSSATMLDNPTEQALGRKKSESSFIAGGVQPSVVVDGMSESQLELEQCADDFLAVGQRVSDVGIDSALLEHLACSSVTGDSYGLVGLHDLDSVAGRSDLAVIFLEDCRMQLVSFSIG